MKATDGCCRNDILLTDVGEVHLLQIIHPFYGTKFEEEIPGNSISAQGHCPLQGHLTEISTICILRTSFNRRILDDRIRCVTIFKRRCVDDQGFDRGTWLPVTLVGTIQGVACDILRTSTHNCSNHTGGVIDQDRCPLQSVSPLFRLFRRDRQLLIQFLLQLILRIQIQGGIDPVTTSEDGLIRFSIGLFKLILICGFIRLIREFRPELESILLHENSGCAVDEIGLRIVVIYTFRPVQCHRLSEGCKIGFSGDFLVRQKVVQDQIPTLHGMIHVNQWIEITRPVWNSNQKSNLRHRKFRSIFVKISMRGSFQSIISIPEIDIIEIEFQDLILGKPLLQLNRDIDFFNLSLPGFILI